ncbi:MAG TPA: efflux transporter outer membrane subunit [Albitalea sp.]|uniref:efflux transporter outer membrane subunit n=1 Tax=Piscinibacter sp. TaxID=1903157 RepID=UPI002ED664DF
MTHRFVFPTLALALLLAGCTSLPAIDPAALPATPAAFKETDPRWTAIAPAEAQPRGEWWKAFADARLAELVERAGRDNASVQVAAARLAQARALLRDAQASQSPQIGLNAGALRQAEPGAGGRGATLVSAGAALSYEVDLFGRLSRASEAASLDARSREALLQSTRLLVQADVAQTYLALRAIDTERAIVGDTVEAYRNTLRLTERRVQAGDIAELDAARARSDLASTEAEAFALERQRAQLEHALAVLVGEPASGFSVAVAADTPPLPQVPAGVPSTVLARRPDVAAAMSQLQAARARVGVAQAAWFPNLSLTATGGVASPEVSDLFKWSARTWGIGALMSLPLLDGGRREAGVQSARADFDAALASYREQVLVAFKDVEDELAALRLLEDQSQAQARAVDSAARATALSASRYRNGLVSQLELLDAQRSELRNRRQAVQVKAAQQQATVGLIRALGGGWS